MKFAADYIIQAEQPIELLFNTRMFRNFSARTGLELEDLFQLIKTGRAFKSKDLPELLLAAHESFCRYNNKPFTATELDGEMWVDVLGGMNSPEVIELYKLFVVKFLNIDPAQFEVAWNQLVSGEEAEEKKSEVMEVPAEGNPLPGASSSNSHPQPA